MNERKYKRVTTACMVVAVGAALTYDLESGYRWIAAGFAAVAALTAAALYLYHQFSGRIVGRHVARKTPIHNLGEKGIAAVSAVADTGSGLADTWSTAVGSSVSRADFLTFRREMDRLGELWNPRRTSKHEMVLSAWLLDSQIEAILRDVVAMDAPRPVSRGFVIQRRHFLGVDSKLKHIDAKAVYRVRVGPGGVEWAPHSAELVQPKQLMQSKQRASERRSWLDSLTGDDRAGVDLDLREEVWRSVPA